MKTIIKQSIICVLACAVLFAGCRMDGGGGKLEEDEPDFMEMVEVPGGTFTMGDDDEPGSNPEHEVTLDGFWISKFLVTQDQFEDVMDYNPSEFDPSKYTNGYGQTPEGEVQGRRPVETVSWYEALVFCNLLSEREGYPLVYSINGKTDPSEWGELPLLQATTVYVDTEGRDPNSPWNNPEIVEGATGYRLPTEAEWEYAAKGGGETNPEGKYYTYSGSDILENVAWYRENSGVKTHEVGKKDPNGLGIYDMTGNVCEWCFDTRANYTIDSVLNPVNKIWADTRVWRGGYFDIPATTRSLKIVYRNSRGPFFVDAVNGFRVARSLPSEETEPSEP